jgi:hypothetical protein
MKGKKRERRHRIGRRTEEDERTSYEGKKNIVSKRYKRRIAGDTKIKEQKQELEKEEA